MCGSYKLRKMKCPPATMLWGCSSGRLLAQGVHDPHGAALDYLNGGARSVIANLWDVTDKDIDKLSMACMRGVFDGAAAAPLPIHGNSRSSEIHPLVSVESNTAATAAIVDVGGRGSMTESLIASRDVCKLKYAVGSAPVVYGVPILMGREMSQ